MSRKDHRKPNFFHTEAILFLNEPWRNADVLPDLF